MLAHPAPGFDEYLPHDLLHFVGEAEWGLNGAIFGQLAAGGDPGIFIPTDERLIPRMMRRRKKLHRRPRGRRSELIAGLLEVAWRSRQWRARLPEDWNERLDAARVTPDRLARVVASLDDLAARWHALYIGESLTLEWPRPERRPHRKPRARA
jgi:hypothetical protein